MTLMGWIILVVCNIPLYVIIGRMFFSSWDEFGEAIAFLLTPSLISAIQGEYWNDAWATMKLIVWVGLCAAATYCEAHYIVIPKILPLFQ